MFVFSEYYVYVLKISYGAVCTHLVSLLWLL